MAVITNTTLQTLSNKIGAYNSMLADFIGIHGNSWQAIQANVRAGNAATYPIGSELITTYTYDGTEYECPWVVLDNNRECEWADGTKHPGLWIGMKYATVEDVQFDAPEETNVDLVQEPNALEGWYYWGKTGSNTYTEIDVSTGEALPTSYGSVKKCGINNRYVLRYGYNRWRHSAYRQWLNSDGDVGEWWSPYHLGDLPPSQLAEIKGFKAGLPNDFLAVIQPVKVKTSCNTVTDGGVTDITVDTFFLQSLEEVYGAPQISNVEGPYFPYWKMKTGLANPTNGSSQNVNNARKIKRISDPAGNAVGPCLRSANRGVTTNEWYMNSSGYLSLCYTYDSSAALPACVIS